METKGEYCQRKERLDDIYFAKWINPKFFKQCYRTKNEFDRVDYHIIKKDGTKVNVELKGRDGVATETNYYPAYFSGTFIEVGKYNNLMKRWKYYGEKPIYINFFENGNTMQVFDLSTAKIKRHNKKVEVSTGENGETEIVYRHELDLATSKIYYYYPEFKRYTIVDGSKMEDSLYQLGYKSDPYRLGFFPAFI